LEDLGIQEFRDSGIEGIEIRRFIRLWRITQITRTFEKIGDWPAWMVVRAK